MRKRNLIVAALILVGVAAVFARGLGSDRDPDVPELGGPVTELPVAVPPGLGAWEITVSGSGVSISGESDGTGEGSATCSVRAAPDATDDDGDGTSGDGSAVYQVVLGRSDEPPAPGDTAMPGEAVLTIQGSPDSTTVILELAEPTESGDQFFGFDSGGGTIEADPTGTGATFDITLTGLLDPASKIEASGSITCGNGPTPQPQIDPQPEPDPDPQPDPQPDPDPEPEP